MSQSQTMEPALRHRVSTNGVLVDPDRWEWRKREAAEAVRKRHLTLQEASELFALPEQEIAEASGATAH